MTISTSHRTTFLHFLLKSYELPKSRDGKFCPFLVFAILPEIYIYIYIQSCGLVEVRNRRKWYQIWIGDISSVNGYFSNPFFPLGPSRFFDSSDIYVCILYYSFWFLMSKKLKIMDFVKYLQTAVLTEKLVFVRIFYFFFISFVFKIVFSYDNLWSISIPKI